MALWRHSHGTERTRGALTHAPSTVPHTLYGSAKQVTGGGWNGTNPAWHSTPPHPATATTATTPPRGAVWRGGGIRHTQEDGTLISEHFCNTATTWRGTAR